MIIRTHLLEQTRRSLRRSRVVALMGPRQCGKTTLAREMLSSDSARYFDLEDPLTLARLEQPMTALQPLKGLVVIDEIQRLPQLFPVLRVLADRRPLPARFLILGSSSPALMAHSSETLAGRMEIIEMGGLSLGEVGAGRWQKHWLRGGFPRSFLAGSESDSLAWRKNFIRTVMERDLPQLGFRIPSTTMFRFWSMLSHYHGQVWNAAEPARSLGISESSVRRYLDVLSDIYLVRQLQPWHANIGKRQVKSPKIYFRDTGLLHQVLGLGSQAELLSHPRCGASWEGYVVEETLRAIEPDEAYFWGTHTGAEIDLVFSKNGVRYGLECKRTDAPKATPSMRQALNDLGLKHIWVVYPGSLNFAISEQITALPLRDLYTGWFKQQK